MKNSIVIVMLQLILTGCWWDKDSQSPATIDYLASYIDPQTPIISACDGLVSIPKILNKCSDNLGNEVSLSNCANIAPPVILIESPSGIIIDPILNELNESIGSKTFNCNQGKNRDESTVQSLCSDSRYLLKGDLNNKDSICRHYPINIQTDSLLTCIEFSDEHQNNQMILELNLNN